MDSTLSEPPLREYVSRRNRWQAERQILERQFIRIGNWRLTLGIAGALLAWLAFGPHLVTAWVLLVLLIAFVALVIWHQRVLRRRTLAERAIAYYERGLARLDDRWIDTGSRGEQFRDASHVYAEDLDVLGKGSLFELIASARTSAGEQTLARWLLSPADREEALSRQEAVRELRARLDLREELALLGDDIRAEVHLEALEKWGLAAPIGFARGLRALALLLALGGVVTMLAFFAQALPLWPFAVILGCDFVVIWNLRAQVTRVRAAIDAPAQGLRILSLILERLEKETFEAPRLKELRAALDVEGLPASKRIARLERWIDWLDSGEHLFVRVIRPVVLYYEQLAMGIEAWRRENGRLVGQWLRAVAEFEALSSLASIAFERPHWMFPLLLETGQPHLEAQDLQHPLMSPAKCVPNDISFSGDLRLFILSGSNMSGKSTLLRSVGLNCVLAWAGGPVAAKRMRVSALQPAASIRVIDSLHDNRSRFFAEISRIRQIVDLTKGNRPVLFLLDELLSGTNSHDRRIGAAGIVRKLVASGAIGLITTHDLALAEIEQDLGTAAANVHFDDQIVDGQIEFDFKLRPGIVTHSNALELMRAVGLEI
jgi:MutS domain V